MLPNICIFCKHLGTDLKCDAFPKGIPNIILFGENEHNKPLPEQENNIVFEPVI